MVVPKRLQKNITCLDVLTKAKPKLRQAIIEKADDDLILCLCECILNVLNGNVPLQPRELQKLSKYKTQLRKIVAPEATLKKKKELITQKGGFLPILLAPILGIAGQLLADAIINKQ